jgi:hypothetical protein
MKVCACLVSRSAACVGRPKMKPQRRKREEKGALKQGVTSLLRRAALTINSLTRQVRSVSFVFGFRVENGARQRSARSFNRW